MFKGPKSERPHIRVPLAQPSASRDEVKVVSLPPRLMIALASYRSGRMEIMTESLFHHFGISVPPHPDLDFHMPDP